MQLYEAHLMFCRAVISYRTLYDVVAKDNEKGKNKFKYKGQREIKVKKEKKEKESRKPVIAVVDVEISKFDTLEIPTAFFGLISPTCLFH